MAELAVEPQPVVTRHDLEAARLLGVRPRDQVLDDAELADRPPQLRQQLRRHPVRVPGRLDQPPDLYINSVHVAAYRLPAASRDNESSWQR